MRPEETIDFHIRWLWSKISRLYNSEASKFGGTMSVGYVLLNIDKEGTPSTKLGPKMGMESRSLTRTLKMMEDENLIVRKQDEQDKRMVRVYLTETGKNYRETSKEVVIRFNEFVRDQIGEKEMSRFIATMEKINELIEDEDRIFEEELSEAELIDEQNNNNPSKAS